MVNEQGEFQVSQLADLFTVSAMTIRRDLDKLAKSGLIDRKHGAATPVNILNSERAYADKMNYNSAEKLKLASVAKKLIHPGDTVFLDAGTTTREIAMAIRSVPDLVVVTNDLKIASDLLDTNLKLIFCGGAIQNETGSALGYMAEEMLTGLRVNVAFIGGSCIDEDFNLLTPTAEKASFKKKILEVCGKAYLVADATKFNSQSLFKITHLSHFTGVVTDKVFSDSELVSIERQSIQLMTEWEEIS